MISPAAFQIVSSVTLRTDPEHLARVQPDVRFHNTSLDTRFPVPGAQNIVRNWYLAYVRLPRDLNVSAIRRIIHALRTSSNGGTKMPMYKPRVRHNDLLSEELEGQHVIYDAANQTVHGLNSTLSWVWSRCDGSRTVDDLITGMQG